MKANPAAAAALLAVIAAVMLITLVAGGGTLLYAAEGHTNTSSHADPSTIAVMTTEEAETILPLMGDIIGLSYDAVYQLYLNDPEYAARYLAAYENTVSRLGTNLGKIKLTQTEINQFRKESAALGTSIRIIQGDVVRLAEIDHLRRQYASEGNSPGLYELAAESKLIYSELALTAENYAGSAEIMQQISAAYGLDPAKLQSSVPLLSQVIIAATSGKLTVTTDAQGNIVIIDTSGTTTDTSGSITISVDPSIARYGDTLTISGIARGTQGSLDIYWDTTLWGTASVDSAGYYTKKLKIGRIAEGIHAVTAQSGGITSKPVYITILSQPSVVAILKDQQENGELHRKLTLYGSLLTEDDLPVVGAPVTVYSEDHILIGTGITNANGIWNVSAELIDGGYAFYAIFDDVSFPLEESMSELYPVTILDPTIYYIILIAACGVLLVLGIRFVVKRRPKYASGKAPPLTLEPAPKSSGPLKKIRDAVTKKEDPDADPLRRLYRKTSVFLAGKSGIANVAVLTPRELLAALSAPNENIKEFISTYEYLHYANVSAGHDQIKHLERLSKQIIEGYT
ncbi:MAG TPA: hypothetical protein O0X79_03380 [Methanocorpusculum sp.]|jgi:hypothetical protein|uniref:DUF4129 domain-containing protein n=1 Tax=Methanocorpusculum parvum TaxID=2193 RepID=A0AAX0Q7E2_9EURY|nr:hypothetical protein [Methanocorpusculum parvum]MDD2248546.1 hypothetical protein [Methanocorpusculum sp.]MDD2803010.1 hypothetical protein [Methanocorpusculum sp.]MDD4423331.1 hypothetical protein [Methanocorpusculum parvum]PAV09174.1 hypothetical protein ASJ83_02075 [Methanocorpusculum parvum]HJJ34690.1 hypothetical protein [Methanocorpusculum sp.]